MIMSLYSLSSERFVLRDSADEDVDGGDVDEEILGLWGQLIPALADPKAISHRWRSLSLRART